VTVEPVLTLKELLAWADDEARRWHEWFSRQPATLLDKAIDVAGAATVRALLLHINGVELRYAQRLDNEEPTPNERFAADTADAVFGIGERAREKLRAFLDRATAEALERVLTFPTRSAGVASATARKVAAHALLHSQRHWAQLAVALRQCGHPTDWHHDLLFSDALR
jgi:uncharacterized damage-inducible protein DinB